MSDERKTAVRFVFDFDEAQTSSNNLNASDCDLLTRMVADRDAASEAEVTRLRDELDQAKLDIIEGRALIASYDRDARRLQEELAVARREYDEVAANHADALQITYDELARLQLEAIASYDIDWAVGTAENVGRLQAIAESARTPAPAPTCAAWCARWLYEWPEGSIPPTRAIVFDEAERASRCFCTRACRDAGAPRNPVKPCETCGVTGGDGFLITNEDGTPCLDRPCPTCSRSVKP